MVADIDFSNPTWDLFIILFFAVAALLYGFSLGRDRIITMLVSTYMALAVTRSAAFLSDTNADIGVNQFLVIKVTAFITIFVVLFVVLSRSALQKTVATADAVGKWWQVIVYSTLHVGLLISIVLSFLSDSAISELAPLTRTLFAGDVAHMVWLILPIIAMVMYGKKIEPEEE